MSGSDVFTAAACVDAVLLACRQRLHIDELFIDRHDRASRKGNAGFAIGSVDATDLASRMFVGNRSMLHC